MTRPERPAGRAQLTLRLLLVCLALAATACGAFGQGGAAQRARPAIPARAAYVAEDGHVYVVPLAGGDAHRVSQITGQVADETTAGFESPAGRWPTWAPDGQRLAFSRVLIGTGNTLVAAQLWTVAHDGTDPRKVWEATDQEPIYFAWAPNGAAIAMLVEGATDLHLIVVDVSGKEPPRRVASGNPFYFTWAADSASLLLHVGDATGNASKPEMGILRLGPPDEFRSLGITPGNFRTPGWSADGRRIAFVANGPDGVATISLVSPEGGDITRVATPDGQAAFMLTPDGTRLAWSARSVSDPLAYNGLEIVTTDGKRRTRVTDDQVMGFYWSPDASQLAYVTIDRSANGWAWNTVDAEGKNPKRLGTFAPTQDQLRVVAFFDQYAISHGTWSPDGTSLTYAIGSGNDPRPLGAPQPGSVQTLPTDGSARAKTLIGGTFVALPVPAP